MYNTDLPNRAELPSSKQLLRSTLIAIIVAAVLLVTIVLPAEYGVDPTRIGRVLGLTQMGEIKMTLAAEAKKASEAEAAQRNSGQTPVAVQPKPAATSQPVAATTPGTATGNNAATKTDEMTVTLKPGQGIEIKMEMSKGARVNYEWTTSGGTLNYDAHGDNASKAFISYKKGAGVTGDAGELVADFDGSHGWFWRNRTAGDVTVTLKTSGEYQSINRVV